MTDVEIVKQQTIRGEPDHVRNAIETARRDGRLVRMTEARRLTTGEVEAVVLLRETRPAVDRRPWFRRRPKLAATMVGALVGFVGLVAWIAYQLIVMVARNFEAVIVATALVIAVIVGVGHKATKAVGCCPCHKR
jgi:hypothetical protein